MATEKKIPLAQRKKLAEAFYFSHYPQKEIAEMTQTPENTISNWVNQYGWKKLREAQTITVTKLVGNLLAQAHLIEMNAREAGRTLDSKETDQIVKIATAVEKLDKKVTVSMIIQVLKMFSSYLLNQDFELAKLLIPHQNVFIRNQISHEGEGIPAK